MATITSPDKAFVFNPSMIKITGAGSTAKVTSVKIGNKEVKRKISGGTAEIDISTLMQNMFDRRKMVYNQTNKYTFQTIDNIQIFIDDVYQENASINIDAFWGSLQIGEKYSQFRKMTFFTAFPFSVPVFFEAPGRIYVKKDNAAFVDWKAADAKKSEIDMAYWNSANNKVVVRNGTQAGSIFDNTFDNTFGVNMTVEVYIDIELTVNKCAEGVYLRWVNKFGDFCYWLFQKNAEQSEVKDINVNIEEYLTTTDFVNSFHAGTNHTKGKDAQRTMALYAPLVDSDTFDFLNSLVESPIVDLYYPPPGGGYTGNWARVNITPVNVVKSTKDELQDFACALMLPRTFTQEL